MTSQLKRATVRTMIDLAQNATDQTAPALFALFDSFLAPALAEFEHHTETNGDDFKRDAERVMLCFVAGMLAANPAFMVMGAPPAMVHSLGGLAD